MSVPSAATGKMVSPYAADRIAWAVGALGAALAVTITVAQLRVGRYV